MRSSERGVLTLPDRWRPGPPPVLLAARCPACGLLSFPPRPQCPVCWAPALTAELPQEGTLYTFTISHAGRAAGGQGQPLGYADLGGVRVLGPLTGATPWVGAPVTVTRTAITGADGDRSECYAFEVRAR